MKKIFLILSFVSATLANAQQKSLFVASAYWCSDSTKNLEAAVRVTVWHLTGTCTYLHQDGLLKAYLGYGAIPSDGKTVWSFGPTVLFQRHERFRITQKTYAGLSTNFVRLGNKWSVSAEVSVLKNFSTPAGYSQQSMAWLEGSVTKHFTDRFGVGIRGRYLYQNHLDANPIDSYYPELFFCDSKNSIRGSLFGEIRFARFLIQPGVSIYSDKEQYPVIVEDEYYTIKTNKIGFDVKAVYLLKRL